MNRHEQELLDKQLWGVSPAPPQSGVMGFAFVAAFLGGLVIGGILFAHTGKQMQATAPDTVTAFSLLNGSPPVLR